MPPTIFTPSSVGPLGLPRWNPTKAEARLGPILGISGVTRDSGGAALGGCTVHLFRTGDNVEVDRVVSDGSGAYAFLTPSPNQTYYIVAYLAGAPDVAGSTVNTLAGA